MNTKNPKAVENCVNQLELICMMLKARPALHSLLCSALADYPGGFNLSVATLDTARHHLKDYQNMLETLNTLTGQTAAEEG